MSCLLFSLVWWLMIGASWTSDYAVCLIIWWKERIGTVILKMSICVFLVINLFYESRKEHPILSWPWYTQSVFWDQFNILSDLIDCQNLNHFLLFCQGLIAFRGNMNISHSSVSFHILNCLSVIGGEREREMIWPIPLLCCTSHSAY